MNAIQHVAPRLRGAIVNRMRCEEAESMSDAEIVRTLAPCVCARTLIEAAMWLRDCGHLSASELSA